MRRARRIRSDASLSTRDEKCIGNNQLRKGIRHEVCLSIWWRAQYLLRDLDRSAPRFVMMTSGDNLQSYFLIVSIRGPYR